MCKINKPVINAEATASRIKELRIRSGFSVREIQTIFNLSSAEAIYSWEKGKYLPSIDYLIVLAAVFGVTVDDIIMKDDVEVECEIGIEKTESA